MTADDLLGNAIEAVLTSYRLGSGRWSMADRRRSERAALVRAALDDLATHPGAVVRRVAGCRGPARPATVVHDPALVRAARPVLDGRRRAIATGALHRLSSALNSSSSRVDTLPIGSSPKAG